MIKNLFSSCHTIAGKENQYKIWKLTSNTETIPDPDNNREKGVDIPYPVLALDLNNKPIKGQWLGVKYN